MCRYNGPRGLPSSPQLRMNARVQILRSCVRSTSTSRTHILTPRWTSTCRLRNTTAVRALVSHYLAPVVPRIRGFRPEVGIYITNLDISCDMDICTIPRIVSSQDWDSGCSPRLEALLFSTRGGPFRFFRYRAVLPRPHPGTPLPGGLLEGSYDRGKHRSKRNQLNIGAFMPASEYETLIRRRCGKKRRL